MIRKAKGRGASASRAESALFCSNMSFGLHAVAQPLTIIRASLFKDYIDRMTRDELQELAGSVSVEVERVCDLFNCLQQLVHIESKGVHLCAMPILPVLFHATTGIDLLYRDSGVMLLPVLPDRCEAVVGDNQRSLEAISSVLLIAHALSSPKQTVELRASSLPTRVQVIVENVSCCLKALNARASLSMALAAANVRSQGGDLTLSLQPFRVEMDFRKAPRGSLDAKS